MDGPYSEILASELLRQIFEAKRRRNPRFSLRGFARQLGISHTYLNLLLHQKRRLSDERRRGIARRLNLSPDLEEKWLRSK